MKSSSASKHLPSDFLAYHHRARPVTPSSPTTRAISPLEHPSEENDREDEIDHIQAEAPLEVESRKPPVFDNLPHSFE